MPSEESPRRQQAHPTGFSNHLQSPSWIPKKTHRMEADFVIPTRKRNPKSAEALRNSKAKSLPGGPWGASWLEQALTNQMPAKTVVPEDLKVLPSKNEEACQLDDRGYPGRSPAAVQLLLISTSVCAPSTSVLQSRTFLIRKALLGTILHISTRSHLANWLRAACNAKLARDTCLQTSGKRPMEDSDDPPFRSQGRGPSTATQASLSEHLKNVLH